MAFVGRYPAPKMNVHVSPEIQGKVPSSSGPTHLHGRFMSFQGKTSSVFFTPKKMLRGLLWVVQKWMIMDEYGIMDDYGTSLLEKMLRVKFLKTLLFRLLHFPKFPLIFPSCAEKKKNTLHTQDTQTPQPWKSKSPKTMV